MKLVVSDTSPVRALFHLGLVGLLPDLFGRVLVPPGVAQELRDPPATFQAIHIEALPGFEVVEPMDKGRIAQLHMFLDRGESEAIALAIEVGADGILMDESDGRAAAKKLGIATIGVVGLLVRAKAESRIAAVLPLLDRLRDQARFFVSPALREQARQLSGE